MLILGKSVYHVDYVYYVDDWEKSSETFYSI